MIGPLKALLCSQLTFPPHSIVTLSPHNIFYLLTPPSMYIILAIPPHLSPHSPSPSLLLLPPLSLTLPSHLPLPLSLTTPSSFPPTRPHPPSSPPPTLSHSSLLTLTSQSSLYQLLTDDNAGQILDDVTVTPAVQQSEDPS